MNPLATELVEDDLMVVPLAEVHREGLRAVCDADADIWAIYPYRMTGENFDAVFDAKLAATNLIAFAILLEGRMIGTSSYLNLDEPNHVLEIGATFVAPGMRGTGVNARMKKLMIEHAIAQGFTRIEFRVDTRNARSMAAVLKLGAVQEGVLRKHRITWTGHIRDSAIFSILADEWRVLHNR